MPLPKPRCLEEGLQNGLAAFADAWADGRYAAATLQAMAADAGLNILADRRGLSSPDERAAFLGGELQ